MSCCALRKKVALASVHLRSTVHRSTPLSHWHHSTSTPMSTRRRLAHLSTSFINPYDYSQYNYLRPRASPRKSPSLAPFSLVLCVLLPVSVPNHLCASYRTSICLLVRIRLPTVSALTLSSRSYYLSCPPPPTSTSMITLFYSFLLAFLLAQLILAPLTRRGLRAALWYAGWHTVAAIPPCNSHLRLCVSVMGYFT
jgi:hypothetical protein